jgi:carbon-monoxide dehydrogenase large subunit
MFAPSIPTTGMAKVISGLYRIPAIRIDFDCAFTNTVPVDAIRGAGKPEALFLLERLVDLAAHETGRTPSSCAAEPAGPADMPYEGGERLHPTTPTIVRRCSSGAGEGQTMPVRGRKAASAAKGMKRGIGFGCHLHGHPAASPTSIRWCRSRPSGLIAAPARRAREQGHETYSPRSCRRRSRCRSRKSRCARAIRHHPAWRRTGGSSSTIISGTTLRRAPTW